MSLLSALILYIFASVILMITFLIIVRRSEMEKKWFGYTVGTIVSLLWILVLIGVGVFVWFQPRNEDQEKL